MDCIHIITNAYNSFLREINSSALIFVEVYFAHLYLMFTMLLTSVNYRRNTQDSLHYVGGMLLSPTTFCGQMKLFLHQTAYLIDAISYFGHKKIRASFAINVWAGIIGNRIVSSTFMSLINFLSHFFFYIIFFDNFQIGPYFLPPRLNGEIYAHFLENDLPTLLEDVPLCVRAELIFQHDGAPPHFSRQIREILNAHYPDRWMVEMAQFGRRDRQTLMC